MNRDDELCANFPPNFFHVLRAARSDVSRRKHPVHRTDAATGRGSLEHHRLPAERRDREAAASQRNPGNGLKIWFRRQKKFGYVEWRCPADPAVTEALDSERRCRAVRPVNMRWPIASLCSTSGHVRAPDLVSAERAGVLLARWVDIPLQAARNSPGVPCSHAAEPRGVLSGNVGLRLCAPTTAPVPVDHG